MTTRSILGSTRADAKIKVVQEHEEYWNKLYNINIKRNKK